MERQIDTAGYASRADPGGISEFLELENRLVERSFPQDD